MYRSDLRSYSGCSCFDFCRQPIICIMGPGDFTTTGHYIVLTGVQEGKFTVNDPNSRERSTQLWTYEQLEGQIRNIWSINLA